MTLYLDFFPIIPAGDNGTVQAFFSWHLLLDIDWLTPLIVICQAAADDPVIAVSS